MKKIIIALGVALSLGGCAALQKLEQTASTIVTGAASPQTVIIATNTFNALEATATNYLNLKKCSVTSGPVCRDPKATAVIIPAIRSGREIRNELISFMRLHPGKAIPSTLYDALMSSVAVIERIEAQYGISKVIK